MRAEEIVAGAKPAPPVEAQSLDIQGWAKRLAECGERRRELEDMAKALKDGPEREAKEALLELLDDLGLDSARAPGIGTVSRKVTKQVRIADLERMCGHMLDRMAEARERGRPLADCLLTTKQALKSENQKWAEEALEEAGKLNDKAGYLENMNSVLAERGLALFLVQDVSLTKAKG